MAKWAYSGRPWLAGNRMPGWEGDTGATGEPLPPGTMGAVSSDTARRVFKLWLYSPEGGDVVMTVPYSAVEIEGGAGTLPTGKLDPQGTPTLIYHGGQAKVLVRGWGGGGGNPGCLLRIYCWCEFR